MYSWYAVQVSGSLLNLTRSLLNLITWYLPLIIVFAKIGFRLHFLTSLASFSPCKEALPLVSLCVKTGLHLYILLRGTKVESKREEIIMILQSGANA